MKCFLCGERVQDVVVLTVNGRDFELCPACVYGTAQVDETDEVFVKQPIMQTRPSYRHRVQRGGVR